MTITKILIIIWFIGWILSSIAYVKNKTRSEASLKESLLFTPNLFLIWPFTVIIYVYWMLKKR